MTDANTGQTVECPICETSFDPTVAGGWCTNTDCGEWQYTDDGSAELVEESDGDSGETDDVVSVPGTDDAEKTAESDGPEPADTSWADDADSAAEAADWSADDADSAAEAADADSAAEAADADSAAEAADADSAAEAADADSAAEAADTERDTEASEPERPEGEPDTDETEPVSETDDGGAEPAEADDDPAADQPSTIDCSDCGSELDVDVNFCPDCGADVRDIEPAGPLTACPSCDSEVEPADNFCVSCGEDLDAHRDGGAVDPSDETSDSETDAVDALESAAETPVPDSLVLEIDGREIDVDDGDKVGREIRAALIEAGRPEDEAVRIHREHVRFVREDDSFYLLDLGDNPTELNGQTLQKGDREPVEPGDEIALSGIATVTVAAP